MAQHAHYWSCSTFADWLRGTPKLKSGTSKQWSEWKKAARKAHPHRYWMAEEALGKIQDAVTWPVRSLYDIKYYCVNRWVTKSHALTAHSTDIKPGAWCDLSNRFLFCMFNELVDFVEIETAWSHIAWGDKELREKYDAPWNATGWFRTRKWRSAEAGLDHLKWASELTWPEDNTGEPTSQALTAIKIRMLYDWWKNVRPARPDPYDASGWSEICDARRERDGDSIFGEDRSDEERAQSKVALDKLHEIEERYEDEDETMMIQLIKIRKGLWT